MQATVEYSLDFNSMKLDTGDERPPSPVFELKKECIITTDPERIPSPGEHFARYQFPTIKKEKETDDSDNCSASSNHDHIFTDNHRSYTKNDIITHPSCTATVAEEQVNPRVFTVNKVMPTMMMPAVNTSMMMTSHSHDMHSSVMYPDMRQRKLRVPYTSRKKQWENAERRKVEQIIEQRSKEWREKQVLWKSVQRQYSAPNSRYLTPSSSTMGRAMTSQSYRTTHYPTRNEHMYYDYQGNPRPEVTMASVEPIMIKQNTAKAIRHLHDDNLVIKDVVSLANETTVQDSDKVTDTILKRRCKRPRKSYEELDTTETEGSDTDENTKSGKYISDLSQPFLNIPDDHQVAHINGLLSLPSNRETRYGITYGELKRRCNPPESLTRVDLVAYVRHSKSSGRNLLDKYHIASANRNARTTILSKMCENEARILADGIMKMNTDFFPSNVLAKTSAEILKSNIKADVDEKNENNEENDENGQQRIKDAVKEKLRNIEVTRSMLKEIYDLLFSEKECCEEMKRYELASHTFGTTNLMNHLKLFDRFFEDYQESLTSRKRKNTHTS